MTSMFEHRKMTKAGSGFGAEDFSNIKRFICIGAHSDDIEMRCGGLFARLARQGAEGLSIVAVDGPYVRGDEGATSSNMVSAVDNIKLRESEAEAGARRLGAANLEFLHLHPYHFYKEAVDNNNFEVRCPAFCDYEEAAEVMQEAVFTGRPFVTYAKYNAAFMKRFEQLIKDWQPDAIFTHSLADRHPDHYAVSDLVFQAVANLQMENEVPVFQWHSGSHGQMQYYLPTHCVELSEGDISTAVRAMEAFSSQFEPEILADYVRQVALTFGHFAGMKYAQPLVITHFPRVSQILKPQEYFLEECRPPSAPIKIALNRE
jgi:LmbE family N-acetylglucosaminyl deacetylase